MQTHNYKFFLFVYIKQKIYQKLRWLTSLITFKGAGETQELPRILQFFGKIK